MMNVRSPLVEAQRSPIMLAEADKIVIGFLRKRGFPIPSLFDPIEMTTISKKRPRRSHKSVSFSDSRGVCVHEYLENDINNAWYSKSDYTSFANECRRVLKETDAVVGEVQKIDASVFCVRGLEDQIIPNVSRMKRNRKRALVRMIVQQYKTIQKNSQQPYDGPDCCESLRTMSTMLSSRSRIWARKLGVLDANR